MPIYDVHAIQQFPNHFRQEALSRPRPTVNKFVVLYAIQLANLKKAAKVQGFS